MKIDDPNISGTSASAGRTQESGSVTRPEGFEAGSSGRSEAGDRVEWSRLTGRVAQTLAAQGHLQAGRVNALAREFQSGHYRVDAGKTSSALVDEMLSASAGERTAS